MDERTATANQANGTWQRLLQDLLPYLLLAILTGFAVGTVVLALRNDGLSLDQGWFVMFLILGTLLAIAVLLWKAPRKLESLHWVEWAVLVVVALVAASIPLLLVESRTKADYVEVPIPATSFIGGVQGLAAGRPVELVALVPNKEKTPEPTIFSDVEIRAFLAGDKDKAEPGMVLVALPPDQAAALEIAVVSEGSKLSYRLLDGTPTATANPAPTSTITPTTMPPASHVFVELAAKDIKPRVETLQIGQPAELIFIIKAPIPDADPQTEAPTFVAEKPLCVHVAAFLDAAGKQQTVYGEKVSKVLLQIPREQLATFARGLAAATDIWLTNKQCPDP